MHCNGQTVVGELRHNCARELGLAPGDCHLVMAREGRCRQRKLVSAYLAECNDASCFSVLLVLRECRVLIDQRLLEDYGLCTAEGIQIQLRLRLCGGGSVDA